MFLAAFVVLILFTYVVYIPIRKITKAADEYAAGNFEKKIDVHSNDEIGYLAASLNYMANELNTLEDDQKSSSPTSRMISVRPSLPSKVMWKRCSTAPFP